MHPDPIGRIRNIFDESCSSPIVKQLGNIILTTKGFATWSGSCNSNHHHYGTGGLAQHTMEVIEFAQINGIKTEWLHQIHFDRTALFLACLYHDVGKMWDYEKSEVHGQEIWQPTPHRRLVHHISRSALVWSNNCRDVGGVSSHLHDEVLHAILSHHGQRSWGSPVAPKTRTAWLLHLSDQLSARMDDCDTCDVVKDK